MLSVGLMADTEELENQIEDGDYEADVDVDGSGGGGGMGGGGAGGGILGGGIAGRAFAGGGATTLLGIGAVVSVLAAILSQLEPIKELIGFLVRQVELFIIPFIKPLTPILNEISEAMAKFIQFTRDPTGFLSGEGPSFGNRGDVVGGGAMPAVGMVGQNMSNMFMPGVAQTLPFLLELSDEALKEKQGGFIESVIGDYW